MKPAGWYYAQGDPPGTQRYWDGELWQGGPVPVGPPSGQPGPPHGGFYPEQSHATAVLVLGILGLVVCGLISPFAWQMGNQELAGVAAGRRDPSNQGIAQVGRIMGIVGTVILVLAVVGVLLVAGTAISLSI